MKNKRLLILCVVCILPGCASLTSSSKQGMIVTTKHNENEANTICSAENSRGEYILVLNEKSIITRSRDNLHIECVNGTQIGTLDVPARRRNVTKFFNIMFDFCTISCLIDRRTGKGFGYTNRQVVYMTDLGGV